MQINPTLSIVSVPLGNPGDITVRALHVLQNCDLLICEERKNAARLFKSLNIPFPSESYLVINEHTKKREFEEILKQVATHSHTAFISDAGTPVLCDPGANLVKNLREMGIGIQVIPGPSALTAALALSGVGGHGFYFAGYPPREKEQRRSFFQNLNSYTVPVFFYETPYRINKVLNEMMMHLPKQKKVFVFVDITGETEHVVSCSVGELGRYEGQLPKGPPVFIIYDE